MSSKLNPKASKKDRPRSTDRLKKGKRDGTPEKSRTPSQEATQDDVNPPSRNYIWNEEIEKLQIKDEELVKLHEPKPPSESKPTPVTANVLVRKVKPAEDWDKPKPKVLTVAKPAPPDAPVKPLDYSGFAGPRYNPDGSVISYSILGSYKDFHKEAVKHGDLIDLPLPKPDDVLDETPTVKYEKKPKEDTFGQKKADENNALMNWQRKMRERKLQQGYISKLLQKKPEDLAMNQADNYRNIQEERYIIDRTIPLIEEGKGYRVGSEFWSQQEQFGDDIKGIHMTLTQTQKGYPPPVEHVGIPQSVRLEKGWTWEPNYTAPVRYPWHKAPYYEKRKKQLRKVINELDSHRPDFDRLEVIGQNPSKEDDRDMTEAISEMEQETRIQETPMIEREAVPDVENRLKPVFGPSLLFAGQPAQWVGSSETFQGEIGIETRVTFESYTGDRVMSHLEIINDGTTSVYFDWKQIPRDNPFDLVKPKIQRFYFNNSNGVILPGETMKFPFVFKSPNAGVFSEQWKFETRPVLIGGADLIVTLRGVALQEDIYETERNLIQQELARREANQIAYEILMEIVNSVQVPARSPSPIDAYITEEEIFTRNNYGIIYHHATVEQLKELYLQLIPEEEREGKFWDLCIQDLTDLVTELDEDDERKETFLITINEAVEKMSFCPFEATNNPLYGVGYQMLADALDDIVGESMLLRHVMGLPERDWDDLESELSVTVGKRIVHSARSGTMKGDLASVDKTPHRQLSGGGEADKLKKTKAEVVPAVQSESRRGKVLDKPKTEAKDKKVTPAKDPKAAKGGKETPKPDLKQKSGSALKKGPSRSSTVTPGPQPVTPTGDRVPTPESVSQSPLLDIDPQLERKYKEKLYTRVYTILSNFVENMDSAFSALRDNTSLPSPT